jgi:hypothetical protein
VSHLKLSLSILCYFSKAVCVSVCVHARALTFEKPDRFVRTAVSGCKVELSNKLHVQEDGCVTELLPLFNCSCMLLCSDAHFISVRSWISLFTNITELKYLLLTIKIARGIVNSLSYVLLSCACCFVSQNDSAET